MTNEFEGRLAFVTGGASGIGAQTCRDLASQGATVVLADLNLKAAQDFAASLPTGDGREHLGLQVDVSVKAQVENAVEQIQKKYGRPADLVVNNAGVADGQVPLIELKEEDYDRVMNVNMKGVFLVSQAFGKALLATGKPGAFVNISSILAYSPWVGMAHYAASKAGVQQFTRVAAKEWGPRGIRVNSIHPGMTETGLTKDITGSRIWKTYQETASLRRVGQPKDVSDAILFLLSDKSRFVTGTGLEVSGQGF